MHLVRHYGPEAVAAVMALHQCDSSVVDSLRTTSRDPPSSVAPLSCTRRLRVDREYRVLLAASGPNFVCKDIDSGAVASRRVGNIFYDRGSADVFLTPHADGGWHAHDDEPFVVRHPTARLPAGSHAPGAPEDDVPSGGGHRPQSRRRRTTST